MSDTPRTDKARFNCFDGSNWITVVEFTFAEELEKENAKLAQEIKHLTAKD
jgi:hypothetical protein